MPATSARRTYSNAVAAETPTTPEISRRLHPTACFNRNTSRTWRIDFLLADIGSPSLSGGLVSHAGPSQACSDSSDWPFSFHRNRCSASVGLGVQLGSEWVFRMRRCTHNFTVVGFDDVHYVARLGSFLMIRSQLEYVVVEVVGLRERDASTQSERGDFDRAGSSKYLDVVPVGMLPMRGGAFRFGVSVFPTLYVHKSWHDLTYVAVAGH
jgi:hypothetical protein